MAVALFAVFTVYGPALRGPFLLDDSSLPYTQTIYAVAPLKSWIGGLRPLLMLSYWLNFQESGVDTGSYHLVNVFLHLLNGALIWLCVRKIIGWAGIGDWHREVLSAFAAGLFLFHPVNTESVSYVASRSEGLSVFFLLAAFAVFLYRRNVSASVAVSAGVLLLFGAACLSKEHAAVLPALLLLTDYYWNPGFSFEGIRRNWKIYVPIIAGGVAALAFVWRVLSAANTAGFGMKDLPWYQYFFTECRALWRYVLLYVLPVGQNIDHDFPTSRTVFDHGAIVGLIGLIGVAGAAWFFRKKYPLISYGVFVALLLLAPTSSFVPIRDTLVERRMYLPFVGFLLVTVGLLCLWKTSQTTLVTVLGAVLLVEAFLSYQRNVLWGDAVKIWADSAEKAPAKERPRYQLAYAYYNVARCPEAVEQFEKAAQIEKPDAYLLIDWALALDCAGNSTDALSKLQQAAALQPTGHVYSQIGMIHAKRKEYTEALAALDTAVKLDPQFEVTYVYRGNVYALQGDKPKAAAAYQQALQLDPQDQVARQGLLNLASR
jgi:predicted negative regulator of RcsB-dependent stress response